MFALLVTLLLTQAPDPLADLAVGREAAARGDLDAAVASLRRTVQAYPAWGLAHVELAEALLAAQAPPEQLGAALTAAQLYDTKNPRVWSLTGRWHEGQGRAEEAIAAFQQALALRPDLQDCRPRLGLLLAAAGRHAEALPELEAGLNERPQDRGLLLTLADLYEKTANLPAAEASLRALVDLAPGSVFHRRLADFYERHGQPEKAERELRKIGAVRPGRKLRPLPKSKY